MLYLMFLVRRVFPKALVSFLLLLKKFSFYYRNLVKGKSNYAANFAFKNLYFILKEFDLLLARGKERSGLLKKNCLAFAIITFSLSANAAGIDTWTGTVDSDWNNNSNWQSGIVPDNTTDVIIPSGLSTYPYITSSTPEIVNLTLLPGSVITISNGTLKIKGTITVNSGSITATNGIAEFTGTSSQSIPGGLFTSNTIKSLVITNAAGVSLAGPVRVTGSVSFGNVNNSVLTTNGFLTLVSTSSYTASLNDITNSGVNTGNQVSGDVTVERYITAKRAFRFLTAPVNTVTSIKANWMENTNNASTSVNNDPVPNYGTHITGSGGDTNGFDATSTNNPSLFTFDNVTQIWGAVPNTNGVFAAGNAYRMLVRGSRAIDLSSNSASPTVTVLRSTGTLVTGSVTMAKAGGSGTAGMPELSSVTNTFNYIGNPYASVVNWLTVGQTDIDPSIYVFDPTITGTNGRGAYVSYNSILDENSNAASNIDNYIQSGESFFVLTAGPNPSITFKETDKSSVQKAVFRTTGSLYNVSVQLLLPSAEVADATAVYYSDNYSSSIGPEDSYKFTNPDENIAILRDGKTLSLEGRKPVIGSDSVPLQIWQLTQNSYTLKITLNKFTSDIQGSLEDKYLHTTTPLIYGETLVPFTITSDKASVSPDRFKIMFTTSAALPVKLTGIKAYEKNKGVQIDWRAESESNMDMYEVERSADAQSFETITSAKAKNDPAISTAYNAFDENPNAGDNYYRIKSIDKSGDVKYSEVVRVVIANKKNAISVCNNPVVGSSVKLLFDNVEKGNYVVNLTNASGEKVYAGKISYAGGTSYQSVNLQSHVAAGFYQLHVSNGTYSKTIPLVMK
ncbi:MAG: C-terminal target protein [Segetibacter sp.]|nr:C-terminal target protein [Segetibacter sp.]